jgi:hypothetical protein
MPPIMKHFRRWTRSPVRSGDIVNRHDDSTKGMEVAPVSRTRNKNVGSRAVMLVDIE